MKQLLYTSCEAGKSLGGDEGFQVRAASTGVAPERIRAGVPYMAYGLPAHIHPLQLAPASTPVRLAFLRTPELGPVLCHSVSAGVDPTTHRPGNFFSHLLMDLPSAVTAAAAIKTWESDTWQRADGPFDVTLPDIEEIRTSEALTDEALRQFLSSEYGQKMFRFVLAAMLTTEADWRIFLAAPAKDVALCVYALTRVLPEGCERTLTFSTYESQPLNCPARVIGTWPADSAETDMPSSCYFGRAVGYNCCTGRASQVMLEGNFIDYAATAVVTDDRNGLDELRAVCDQCGIDRPDLLNLVCRAEMGGELSKDDLCRLASYPRFLAHLLNKPSTQRVLLDRFTENQELTGVLSAKVVPVLKEDHDAIAGFREIAKHAATQAILHGALVQARAFVQHILPAASDAPRASAHMAVLAEITDPRAVPWQTRAYLLTQIAGTPANGQQTTLRAGWLAPSPAELPLLADLSIPDGWKTHACLTCLRDAGVTRSLVETLTNHPELLLEVLRHLPGNKEGAGNLPSLVAALLASSRAPAVLVGDIVRDRRQLSPEVTSAFLAAAARYGAIDVFSLASHGGPGLLEVLHRGEDCNTFLVQLLDCPPERLLNDSQVLALFRAAVGNMDRGEIRDGLESILAIRSFLDRPVLGEETLARVSMGLKAFQSPAIGNLVLKTALDAMLAREDSPSVGRIPESLLRNLGPFIAGGPGGLYRGLLEQFRVRKDFWRRQHLICAMVAVGLGATGSAALSRQAVVMAEQARDLAEEVAKRSKRRVFAFIERQSHDWPDEARVRWNLFAKFVRPRRLIDRIAGPWKKTAAVPLVILCLVVGASRLSCRGGTIGTGFANDETLARQSHETRNPLAEGIGHDRPQP
jgi:hypothetical protein